jgi:MarR family transcriptional regulator, transcriptional regulator for hemolysin
LLFKLFSISYSCIRMSNFQWQEGDNPLGLYLSFLTKQFIGTAVKKLSHIDLDRYFRVLLVVEQSGETFTQQKLADYFKLNKASMVRIIDYLTKKGFLERRVNRQDRREHLLILTDKAKKVLPEIKQTLNRLDELALSGFTPAQKEQFFQSLEQMYTNLSKLPAEDIFLDFSQMKNKRTRPVTTALEHPEQV